MTDAILATYFDDVIAAAVKAKAALAPPVPIYPLTDRLPRGKPSLPILGPAGFTFADPIFHSRMARVTDHLTDGGSMADPTSWRTSSATDRQWSANGLLFFAENAGGGCLVFSFDPGTLAFKPVVHVPLVEPTWDQLNPDLLYGRGQGERPSISRFDVTKPKDGAVVVWDALTAIPVLAARDRTYLRGTTHALGSLCCICGGTSQGYDDFAVCMHLGPEGPTDVQIIDLQATLGIFAHACTMDQTGRYVIIGTTQAGIDAGKARNYVWDTITGSLTGIEVASAGHGAIGYGVSINAANIQDSQEYWFRHLDSAAAINSPSLVIPMAQLPTPRQSFQSNHLSWNNVRPGNTDPFLVANFRFGPGYDITPANPWRPWDDELILVSMDGSRTLGLPTVKRICHHRSNVLPDGLPPGDPHTGYWATPRPRINPVYPVALFTSNWEKNLGAYPKGAGDLSPWRQDVFLVALA